MRVRPPYNPNDRLLTVGEVIESVERSALAQEHPILLVVAYIDKNKKGQLRIRRQTIPFDSVPTPEVANKATAHLKDKPNVRLWFDCVNEPPRLGQSEVTRAAVARLRDCFRAMHGREPPRIGTGLFKVDHNAKKRQQRLEARNARIAQAQSAMLASCVSH